MSFGFYWQVALLTILLYFVDSMYWGLLGKLPGFIGELFYLKEVPRVIDFLLFSVLF